MDEELPCPQRHPRSPLPLQRAGNGCQHTQGGWLAQRRREHRAGHTDPVGPANHAVDGACARRAKVGQDQRTRRFHGNRFEFGGRRIIHQRFRHAGERQGRRSLAFGGAAIRAQESARVVAHCCPFSAAIFAA